MVGGVKTNLGRSRPRVLNRSRACWVVHAFAIFCALCMACATLAFTQGWRSGSLEVRRSSVLVRAAAADSSASSEEAKISLKLVTPEGTVIDTKVTEVVLPGLEGSLGILRGHAPLMAPMATGLVKYRTHVGGEWTPAIVMGGFASVSKDVVTVLSSVVEEHAHIPSVEDARIELEKGREAFEHEENQKGSARLQVLQQIKKASARLQAALILSKAKKP
eukprot:CAMPEP_0178372690 /NCGR_PEP_ID=MMETSP0689_2-20121128/1483_1 /TAXON_ID=160604 /ORGANISM="Amphidinium massartii, Strain CS-259" /LENGTH=218 /DNA_ID=CAMNT_0019992621 /DNA_START=12 /DNA_END=668 /DNA_ORIENTATION=+